MRDIKSRLTSCKRLLVFYGKWKRGCTIADNNRPQLARVARFTARHREGNADCLRCPAPFALRRSHSVSRANLADRPDTDARIPSFLHPRDLPSHRLLSPPPPSSCHAEYPTRRRLPTPSPIPSPVTVLLSLATQHAHTHSHVERVYVYIMHIHIQIVCSHAADTGSMATSLALTGFFAAAVSVLRLPFSEGLWPQTALP